MVILPWLYVILSIVYMVMYWIDFFRNPDHTAPITILLSFSMFVAMIEDQIQLLIAISGIPF